MMYEMITSKFSKKFWGILLSLLLAIGMGGVIYSIATLPMVLALM